MHGKDWIHCLVLPMNLSNLPGQVPVLSAPQPLGKAGMPPALPGDENSQKCWNSWVRKALFLSGKPCSVGGKAESC